MNILMKKAKVMALAFAYAATSIAPAMADDSEIYLGSQSSTTGVESPNILLLLDNSGSMKYPMYNVYPDGHPLAGQTVPKSGSNATYADDQRGRHLINATKSLLQKLNSSFRVGISQYNASADGGHIVYPVKGLDESVSATGGVEERTLKFSTGTFDVSQTGSAGGIVEGQSSLSVTGGSGYPDERVGLMFPEVPVPKGATVTSAELIVTSNQKVNGTAKWLITRDPSATPVKFTATGGDLFSSRWPVSDGSAPTDPDARAFTLSNWANGQVTSFDITELVNEHVQQVGYCGNASGLALRIREVGSSVASRSIYSFDSDPERAPKLRVKYTLPTGSTCIEITRQSDIGSSVDDGQVVGVSQTLSGKSAELRSSSKVGLRFQPVAIPKNAKIRSVELVLTASNSPSSNGSMSVSGALFKDPSKSDDYDGFDRNSINSIANWTAAQSWSIDSWQKDKTYSKLDYLTSPTDTGLTQIVQEIVDQSGWPTRNPSTGYIESRSIVLQLVGSIASKGSCGDKEYPCFKTRDDSTTKQPKLIIKYESNNPLDGVRTVRQDLLDIMDNYKFPTSTPLNETYYESALYMLGRTAYYGRADGAKAQNSAGNNMDQFSEAKPAMVPGTNPNQYKSPITGGECQANAIIMLTDGEPTNDSDKVTVDPSKNGICSASWGCMNNTAKYLHETGYVHPATVTLPDGSTTTVNVTSYIKTYSVGFGPDVAKETSSAYKGLAGASRDNGGGDHFFASDSDSLVNTFQTIFARLADTNGTMASPGVAVNQMNRTQHLNQLYYGVFRPETTKRWPGNIKRYALGFTNGGVPQVEDVSHSPAIDSTTKTFSSNAQSWWSSGVDGKDATKGGAAEKQTAALKVYTDNGSNTNPVTSVLNENSPPSSFGSGQVGIDNARWIKGYDVDTTNPGGNGFRQSIGSPMHSQPVMLAKTNGSDQEAYTVFVSTNDGLLHSINNKDGTHNWAFLPSDLQGNIANLRANDGIKANEHPLYGLDAPWTMVGVANYKDKRLLIGGMRQGGKNYYAVEVDKNPATAPSLKWVIRPSKDAKFANLGYTWSQPQFTYVRTGSPKKITPVVVFGGGLDYDKYELGKATASAGKNNALNDKGNAIYMVNAETGDLIWWASSDATSGADATKVSSLTYSVPGSIRVVDKNGDGLADHLYFGDIGGQIFRVDIDNATSAPKLVNRVALLAQLGNSETVGKSNDRRFYEMPAVEYVFDAAEKLYAAVAIGSGNRNFPNSDKNVEDRFYVIRDYDAARFDILSDKIDAQGTSTDPTNYPHLATKSGPFTTASLLNLSAVFGSAADTAANASGVKGWWIKMPGNGEKVLSSPFIFSRKVNGAFEYQVNFNSFSPDATSSSGCSPVAGSTSAWSISLNSAKSIAKPNSTLVSDRYTESVAVGITGSSVPLIIDVPKKGPQVVELIGTGAQIRGDAPAGLGIIHRTRWYDRP